MALNDLPTRQYAKIKPDSIFRDYLTISRAHLVIAWIVVMHAATVARGGQIEIANSGFEEPGLAELELEALPNLDGTVPPPGAWYSAIALHSKIMHVNSSLFTTGAAEGVNALRMQARAGAHAQQNVGPILLNHRYTLTAQVGRSLTEAFGPSPNFPYYYALSARFALPLASYTLEIARSEDPVSPTPGAWAPLTFTFDTPDADSLDQLAPGWRGLGEADLLIDFHAIRNAVSGGDAAVYFDNVRLTVSPVPEPSTAAMALSAIIIGGLNALRRRRARAKIPVVCSFAFIVILLLSVGFDGLVPIAHAGDGHTRSLSWKLPAGGVYDFKASWDPQFAPDEEDYITFGDRLETTLADEFVLFLESKGARQTHINGGNYEFRFGNPGLTYAPRELRVGFDRFDQAVDVPVKLTIDVAPFAYSGTVAIDNYLVLAGHSNTEMIIRDSGTYVSATNTTVADVSNLTIENGASFFSSQFRLGLGTGDGGEVYPEGHGTFNVRGADTYGQIEILSAGISGSGTINVESGARLDIGGLRMSSRTLNEPTGVDDAFGVGRLNVGDFSGSDSALVYSYGDIQFDYHAGGIVDLRGGGAIVLGGEVIPTPIPGTLEIGFGSAVVADKSSQTPGSNTPYEIFGDVVIEAGGILSGRSIIHGSLINHGELHLASSALFAQSHSALGASLLATNDTAASIRVDGDLILDGKLILSLEQDAALHVGDVFALLSVGGALQADNLLIEWLNAPSGLEYVPNLVDGQLSLQITAVPEPSAWLLFLLGTAIVGLARLKVRFRAEARQ